MFSRQDQILWQGKRDHHAVKHVWTSSSFNIFNQQADLYWEAIGLEDLKTTCVHALPPPALLNQPANHKGNLWGCSSAPADGWDPSDLLKVNRWCFCITRHIIERTSAEIKPLFCERMQQRLQVPGWLWMLGALRPGEWLQMVRDQAGKPRPAAWPLRSPLGELGLPAWPSFLAQPNCHFQRSWTGKANSSPAPAKVTPLMLMWFASTSVQRMNF